MRLFNKIFATSIIALFLMLPLSTAEVGASPGDIKVTTPFPKIKVGVGQKIQMPIDLKNLGTQYETLTLVVSKPENWETTLKSGGYLIEMVSLAPGENRTVDLTISPPPNEKFGSYTVEVKALDDTGSVKDTLNIVIEITEIPQLGILLSTPNPSIEGPGGEGKKFEFTVEVRNETGEERDISFSAIYPTDWNVTFSPAYEKTVIRAIHLKDGERKSVKVTITPPPNVDAGEYTVTVEASAGPYKRSLDLTTVITGTYKVELSTADGLLSLNAIQGTSAPVSLIVKNTGTGLIEGMNFRSTKPSGWEVTFEPDEISQIPPNGSKEVSVGIKPPADAIPGDYKVTLVAYTNAPNAISERLELRVTVLGSIAWGLVGLFIIMLVVVGLIVIFWRLGRR